MGKVLQAFGNGFAGQVSRSKDDIIVSLKNTGGTDIPFGAPVFLYSGGAKAFDTSSPQAFTTFLGFAVRVVDKTPETYPAGQNEANPAQGVWKAGSIMEVLVRGTIALPCVNGGHTGDSLRIRKSDGKLTALAGTSDSTVELTNVVIRKPCDSYTGCCEATVKTRNVI